MIPADLYKKIQAFHFKTKRMANNLYEGQYQSAFKGRGMEFAEVREYEIGDDIRLIDWNVSARFGKPFVKVFHEERELTVMLLLDISGSQLFGSRVKFKRELMAELAGMLAFLAIKTNDTVGALLFSSKVEKFIPPKKGAAHVWRLIKEIFTFEPESPHTNIDSALVFLNRVMKRHAIVFMLSDCLDVGYEKSLRLTARKHDLTVLRLSDPAEDNLPNVGLVTLKDPETGQVVTLNTRNKTLRTKWEQHRHRQLEYLKDLLRKNDVDLVMPTTNGDLIEPLIRMFHSHKGR